MSVTFADLWSGIAGRRVWSFGDCTTATGTRGHHTSCSVGHRTLRITPADRLGHVGTVSYRIAASTVRGCVIADAAAATGRQPGWIGAVDVLGRNLAARSGVSSQVG